MRSFRGLALSVALVAGGLFPLAGTAPHACAASAHSAALVVDTGGKATAYCVELPSGSVDGIDLIKLASKQYGLSYNLGFGGKAVCALNGVGVTDSGNCFAAMPDYWGLWLGNGSGGWTWSSVGAASVSVGPGDVQGWAWGSGKDGSSHPAPPNTDYAEVCKVKDGSNKDGGGSSGGGTGGSDTGGTGGTGQNTSGSDRQGTNPTGTSRSGTSSEREASQTPAPRQSPRADRSPTTERERTAGAVGAATIEGAPTEASPSAVILAAPLAGGSGGSSGGPPVGALLALAAAAALAAAGFRTLKGAPRGKHRAGHAVRKG